MPNSYDIIRNDIKITETPHTIFQLSYVSLSRIYRSKILILTKND